MLTYTMEIGSYKTRVSWRHEAFKRVECHMHEDRKKGCIWSLKSTNVLVSHYFLF